MQCRSAIVQQLLRTEIGLMLVNQRQLKLITPAIADISTTFPKICNAMEEKQQLVTLPDDFLWIKNPSEAKIIALLACTKFQRRISELEQVVLEKDKKIASLQIVGKCTHVFPRGSKYYKRGDRCVEGVVSGQTLCRQHLDIFLVAEERKRKKMENISSGRRSRKVKINTSIDTTEEDDSKEE